MDTFLKTRSPSATSVLHYGRLFGTILLLTRVTWAAERDVSVGKVDQYNVYIGTYTGGASEGIYISTLDVATGRMSPVRLAAQAVNPSFLAIHPERKRLYAVGEVNDPNGQKTGGVSAFSIDPKSGELTLLNQRSSGGRGPCHLVVDATGRHVLVANYGGGSVASIPLQEDGRLGPLTSVMQHEGSSVNPKRQEAPHAHSINLDPANRFAFAADLGLDKVLIYRFDSKQGSLAPNEPPSVSVQPGAGPRHFCFHPSGRYAYVINEMDLTVTAFRYHAASGTLETLQTLSTLPEGSTGDSLSTAEVRAHPNGKILYGSNRGHNSIAVFEIDPQTGKLTLIQNEPTQGETPRNFALDPSGRYLLAENQNTDTIVVFRIDAETGRLTPTGQKLDVPTPVCIRMIPSS